MHEVSYRFNVDDRVVTPFGDTGIITMLGFDDGGNQYYVKTKLDSQWYKERDLIPGKQCLTEVSHKERPSPDLTLMS